MTQYDRWSRDGMPDGDVLRRIQRGIDATMRDAIADSRRGISQSTSMIPEKQRAAEERRPPSGGTVEVRPPPGINIIDQMCDAADRQDRIAAIRQRIENAWIEAQLDRSKPNRAKSEYSPAARYDDEVPPLHRDKD